MQTYDEMFRADLFESYVDQSCSILFIRWFVFSTELS